MRKYIKEINVYDASNERIKFIRPRPANGCCSGVDRGSGNNAVENEGGCGEMTHGNLVTKTRCAVGFVEHGSEAHYGRKPRSG